MADKRIIILIGRLKSTSIICNSLINDLPVETVIVEKPESKMTLLNKRHKRLGFITIVGQILFQVLIIPYLKLVSRQRLSAINRWYQFNTQPIHKNKVIWVSSINSDDTLNLLQTLNPDLVLVYGTRIISRRILQGVAVRFVNLHPGITPYYRGVHGAYWALADKNPDACGVTIHYVDHGIDTGDIIAQAHIAPAHDDNFITYPWIQIGVGLPLLKKAVRDVFSGKSGISIRQTALFPLRSHPTLWGYVWYRLRNNVK